MSATEIILIVIGVAVFLLGYLMPARRKDIDEEVQLISEDEVRKLVTAEVEHVKDKIADIVDETVNYSIEKAERAMERVTNEKIMAVNEYSDTVLEEINKNHKEVVFLYDMLNDKHDNLMSSINAATIASDGIKQTARDAELTASEAADKIDAVLQSADEAADTIQSAQETAIQAKKVAQEALRIIINISKKQPVDEPEPVEETVMRQEEPALADSSDMEWESWSEENDEIPEIIGETEPFEEPEEILELEEESEEIIPEEEAEESVDFTPIAPRRVEIIHQPDGDYVAGEEDDLSTSAAFASMGFFTPKTEEYEEPSKKNRLRRNSRKDRLQENAATMDIQFAQGKDNGRNSNERILELHKAGKSNMAIAKELGLGLGEVKLVIDLFEGM
ncbi:MAG: hypothetical protein K2O65_14215 [Lachnospiraceae bacterium]|nr:hypothetical protein [Lachnospiraceae bacterium]